MRTGIAKLRAVSGLDTVGVAGSTPVEPTILKLKPTHDIIEIPEDYEVIPSLVVTNGHYRFSRVLIKTSSKSSDKVVTFSRSKKGA